MYNNMRKRKQGYYTGRHSCFLLKYRLILVTKLRRPLLTGKAAAFLESYTRDYFEERSAHVTEIAIEPDHVQIRFETVPGTDLGKFTGVFKAASSRRLLNLYGGIPQGNTGKALFWSFSYFLGTEGGGVAEAAQAYLEETKGDE